MSHRLSFLEFKNRAIAQFADSSIKVGTCMDRDYMTAFANSFPAVWITAQKITPADDGRGFSGIIRQNLRTAIIIRCLVSRVAPTGFVGIWDPEASLAAIETKVREAFFGWTPVGARMPLAWEQIIDGPPYESCVSSDLYFVTEVADARSLS